MRTPWSNSTGLARMAAIFATVLIVALGLCGTQAGVWFGLSSWGHEPQFIDALTKLFIVTGYVEVAAVVICLVGLGVIGVVALVRVVVSQL